MPIKNLTPHVITLYAEADVLPDKGGLVLKAGAQPLATFPSEGVARATVTETLVDPRELPGLEFPVFRTEYGAPVDLPAPAFSWGVYLVVSALTAQAAKRAGRETHDLLIPTHLVRDANGKVVGCTGFSMV